MKYFNFKTTITILAVSLILVSCNETKTNDKEKSLTEKEIELLKKENELLKREQELNKTKEIEADDEEDIEPAVVEVKARINKPKRY